MNRPPSILPKTLRRAGTRRLALSWPVHERRAHYGRNQNALAFLHRSVHEHWIRLGRQARKAAAK